MVERKMDSSRFEAAVGMSRKWDAREAGREVTRSAIEKLNRPPSFFLLFSTIHYEKHGGFQEFLNGVWDVLPEGTPLIGGTVVGFMNDYGCYTRGCTAIAVSYPNMDVAVGVGYNTKKNPEKAAGKCAEGILMGFKNSKYKESFIFQLVSGATMPHFPGIGGSFVLKGKIKSSLAAKLIETSTRKLQKGIGREEEVLEKMSKKLEKSFIISGSSSDDMKLAKDYQFISKGVSTNSIVAIGFKIDKKIDIRYNHGFHKLFNEKLKITDSSFDNRIIKKINNKDAVSEFTRAANWSESAFEESISRKTSFYNLPTVYFPLGFEYPDKTLAAAAVGAILGKGISFNYRIDSDDLFVLTASGKNIVDAIDESIDKNSDFIFGVSCCGNLVTLGDDMCFVQKKIRKNIKNFLVVFTLGEGVYNPLDGKSKFFNEANIILSIK